MSLKPQLKIDEFVQSVEILLFKLFFKVILNQNYGLYVFHEVENLIDAQF